MEFTSDKIQDAIYYVLTINPNKTFTIDDLCTVIKCDNICNSFFAKNGGYNTRSSSLLFKEHCKSLPENFTNVSFDGTYYSFKQTELQYDINKIETIVNTFLESSDNIDFDFHKIYQKGQSVLHILCILNKQELLSKLSDMIVIDFDTPNNEGQTLYQVTDNLDFLNFLIKLTLKQYKEQRDYVICDLKMRNTELSNKNEELENNIYTLSENKRSHIMFNILFFAISAYSVFTFYKF